FLSFNNSRYTTNPIPPSLYLPPLLAANTPDFPPPFTVHATHLLRHNMRDALKPPHREIHPSVLNLLIHPLRALWRDINIPLPLQRQNPLPLQPPPHTLQIPPHHRRKIIPLQQSLQPSANLTL